MQKRKPLIFYSWQGDSPNITNREYIHNILLHIKDNLNFEITDASSVRVGSEHVPGKIMEAINGSDIFICDITTINKPCECKTEDGKALKRTPNPNVIFELGYAVATLGWRRIIMLFNESLGEFPDDLPFDFKGHYCRKYSHTNDLLIKSLSSDIQEIIATSPAKPLFKNLSLEEIKRTRDISTIIEMMSTLHLATIDEFLSSMPASMEQSIMHFWLGFESYVTSSLFDLYDEALLNSVKHFFLAWRTTLSFDEHYDPISHINRLRSKDRSIYKKIEQACIDMRNAYHEILYIIREKYVEVDLTDSSRKAWKEYVEIHSKFQTNLL